MFCSKKYHLQLEGVDAFTYIAVRFFCERFFEKLLKSFGNWKIMCIFAQKIRIMELMNTSSAHTHTIKTYGGSLSNTFSTLSQEDVVWAIRYLQTKLKNNANTDAKNVVFGDNGKRLVGQLKEISNDKSLLVKGMRPISKEIFQAVKRFIVSCPDDGIFAYADCFPRMNGTLLICWNKNDAMASVNIGESSFTYAITNPKKSTKICGEGSLTVGDISIVYKSIEELL